MIGIGIGGELFPQNPIEVRTKMVGWEKDTLIRAPPTI